MPCTNVRVTAALTDGLAPAESSTGVPCKVTGQTVEMCIRDKNGHAHRRGGSFGIDSQRQTAAEKREFEERYKKYDQLLNRLTLYDTTLSYEIEHLGFRGMP